MNRKARIDAARKKAAAARAASKASDKKLLAQIGKAEAAEYRGNKNPQ